jgi:hypothetical protein
MQSAEAVLDIISGTRQRIPGMDHWRAVCRETDQHGVRREALRRIPGSAGRNLEEHSWVNGLPGRESARGQ